MILDSLLTNFDNDSPFYFDHESYAAWRFSRCKKLISWFGSEWFSGKRILEVGAGLGHIGAFFQTHLNASVTVTDVRPTNIDESRRRFPYLRALVINHEQNDWLLDEKFDLIINFGLLYHLQNFEPHLLYCLQKAPHLALETESVDSSHDEKSCHKQNVIKQDDGIEDHAWRPSASYIERMLGDAGATFTRFDDADLNAHDHRYDWSVTGSGQAGGTHRRFWIINTGTER